MKFELLLEKMLELKQDESEKYLYHLAAVNYGPVFRVEPRVPDKEETLEGEDSITPRISLAPSITKAIRALGPFMIPLTKVLWVYKTSKDEAGDIYAPSEDEVPDVEETDEVWSKHPLTLIGDVVIKVNYTTSHYESGRDPTFKIIGGPEKFRETEAVKSSLSRKDIKKLYSYQPGDVVWQGSKIIWIEKVTKGQLVRKLKHSSPDFELYRMIHNLIFWKDPEEAKWYWVMRVMSDLEDFGFETQAGEFVRTPYILVIEDDIVELVQRPDDYDINEGIEKEQKFLKSVSPVLQREYSAVIAKRKSEKKERREVNVREKNQSVEGFRIVNCS